MTSSCNIFITKSQLKSSFFTFSIKVIKICSQCQELPQLTHIIREGAINISKKVTIKDGRDCRIGTQAFEGDQAFLEFSFCSIVSWNETFCRSSSLQKIYNI